MTRERGQLVVLAALALALALVPMTLAYLQLGYDDDVQTVTVQDDTVPDAKLSLHQTLVDASADIPARHTWADRDAAVDTVRHRLQPTVDSLTNSTAASEMALTISYNDSRAGAWARTNCPSGPARRFGPCESDRGVVIQEREGRTHVLAIAVDVTVTTPDTERATTAVIAPWS